MVETFAALAEPNRLRIVELLRAGPQAVNDIGERLALNQPQVSKHLKVLKAVGLVGMEARAQKRVYRLRGEPLQKLAGWLEKYRQLWDARFTEMDEIIEELKAKEKANGRRKR